jgi:hypothetical protein
MRLNINCDAVVKFTARLERMAKSDLPVAVRSALNDAAYDVKTNTMPKSAEKTFEKRQPNFFKANSRFEKAEGFKISQMKSTVGFKSDNLKGSNNFAVKDLEQQEKGGKIGGKAFIPMNPARVGQNKAKAVRSMNRTTAVRNIVDSNRVSGANGRQSFIRAAFKAGKGGHVLGNRTPKILWRVNSLNRTADGRLKMTPLYSYKENRGVSVKRTSFMESASKITGAKMEGFFEAQAKKRIFK